MIDSTRRFSDRVEAYIKFRPGYPPALVSTLLEKTGLDADAVVADVGSGTGIFTRQLLDQGLRVNAVEPNANMRRAAEALLSEYPKFISIDAPAEHTGLADNSIDLVTAAQAFHWFNNEATKAELERILKPGGKLALIWNKRKISQPFQQAYLGILNEYAPEYGKVNHMNLSEDDIAYYFADANMELLHFDSNQRLDFAGLMGRLKSASYCPAEDSPQYIPLVTELVALFDQYAADGVVDFEYDTQLYLGAVDSTEDCKS
ncbi:MAG: class I SAM-dependent methyltransferase [Gammaproteobacteria bacterium]|nr:class I SAM-dependent methyltransferase [Gammaproteobacteria bacterium]MDH3858225.1 class I SAM-dependent methyltransferase [Gammaproteobacteria bacterium]